MDSQAEEQRGGTVRGRVVHGERQDDPIIYAEVGLYKKEKPREGKEAREKREPISWVATNGDGRFEFKNLPEGLYWVVASAFGLTGECSVVVKDGCADPVIIALDLGLIVTMLVAGEGGECKPVHSGVKGKRVLARLEYELDKERIGQHFFYSLSGSQVMDTPTAWEFDVLPALSGEITFIAKIVDSVAGRNTGKFAEATLRVKFFFSEPEVAAIGSAANMGSADSIIAVARNANFFVICITPCSSGSFPEVVAFHAWGREASHENGIQPEANCRPKID